LETVLVSKLVLITNSKSHMSFPLVPKLVTLNVLERRNGAYMGYFTEFGANYDKVVEDKLILSATKMKSKK